MNIPDDIMEMAKVFAYKQVGDADTTSCAPRLTGIPPHVVVINNLHPYLKLPNPSRRIHLNQAMATPELA